MYRHVSTFHLDLGQLWRCPVSWCTVWKGTPQDCMDHVCGAHDVPSDIKSTSLDRFFPPWTVRRQILADALKPCHSGVSTDVLLFSEAQLALVHHYRVFRRGLPHQAFRRDYLTRLRVFISQASALAQSGLKSLVPGSSDSPRNVRPCDTETKSHRKTRRVRHWMRPTRLQEDPVHVLSPVTVDQTVQDLTGAVVYDCRPRLLPVSITLQDCLRPSGVRPAASASLAAPSAEETMMLGSTSTERSAPPEFAVTISDDPRFPEPDVGLPVSQSLYLTPPVDELPDPTLPSSLHFSPLRVGNELPTIDLFPSLTISLAQSYYDPYTSPVTSDIPDASGYLFPRSPAAMDWYLVEDGDLLLDEPSDFAPVALTPVATSG